MLLDFYVKSRYDIHNGFCPSKRSALISITDPDKDHCDRNHEYDSVLQLKFSDADSKHSEDIVLFDIEMAKSVNDFVKECISNEIYTIVVNCEAGMSRSAGLAAGISYIFNETDWMIIKTKPFYNRFVHSTYLNANMETLDFTFITDFVNKIKK